MLNERVIDVIKKSKPFKAGDVLVYIAVLVTIAVLFLSFVIFPTANNSTGFTVTVNGEKYFTFSPTENKLIIADGKDGLISKTDAENGVYITVYSKADKSQFNVIFFDTENGTAKITESNCSTSHDCTFTPKIKDSGAIYCAPHGLKVVPSIGGGFSEPITG